MRIPRLRIRVTQLEGSRDTAHQSVNRLCRHIRPRALRNLNPSVSSPQRTRGKPDAAPLGAYPFPVRRTSRKCFQLLPKSAQIQGRQIKMISDLLLGAPQTRFPERNHSRNALGRTQVPALPSICRSGFRTCKLLRPPPNPVTPQGIGNGSYSTNSRKPIG